MSREIRSFATQDEEGHKSFEEYNCKDCLNYNSEEDGKAEKEEVRKKVEDWKRYGYTQRELKELHEAGDPAVGFLGEPTGRPFEFYVLYGDPKTPPKAWMNQKASEQKKSPNTKLMEVNMTRSVGGMDLSSDYDSNFPPLEYTDRATQNKPPMKDPNSHKSKHHRNQENPPPLTTAAGTRLS